MILIMYQNTLKDQFLDSRAKIHQIFVLGFLEKLTHQNIILKLTDL